MKHCFNLKAPPHQQCISRLHFNMESRLPFEVHGLATQVDSDSPAVAA